MQFCNHKLIFKKEKINSGNITKQEVNLQNTINNINTNKRLKPVIRCQIE